MHAHRAYSLLELKSVSEDDRVIVGIASTIEVDRMGDIVEPSGAEFTLPIPLLWQHNSREPIGEVFEAKVTKTGIEIKARVVKIDEPGKLKDRLDEAWQSLKAKLVRGLSIGFDPLESARIEGTYGLRFIKWSWLELSCVTIPANATASIQSIKSFDAKHLAASGRSAAASSTKSAGDSASTRVVKAIPKDRVMKKTVAEQIKDFEATRQAKSAERDGIMDKSAESGETLDAAQTEQYDTLTGELKSIDDHLVRLRAREEELKKSAVPASGSTAERASDSRGGTTQVAVKDTMPPDVAFGAMVLCKAHSYLQLQKGNLISPMDVAKQRYPSASLLHAYFQQKTAVIGGTTTDSNFASALLAPSQVIESAFLEYLRPKTLIDRFGTNQNGVQIPSLLRVPFNVKVQSQTSGASAGWVGEGKPKLVTKFNTTSTTLLFTKIAAISVITEELARFSRPGAETLVRNELAKSVIAKMDTDFIDPAVAVSSGVNPASITNGVTALTTAGVSAANVLTDIQALVAPFMLNGYDISQLVILMPNTLALTLSLMQNSLGQDSFKGMTAYGGQVAGIPVLASQYLASGASYGNMVVCVSAENVALADDGSVTVDASREASIEMVDSSSQDATTGTGASLVSMFQTNSIALRAEREINWKKLRSTAVTFMDDVNWGSIGSPF